MASKKPSPLVRRSVVPPSPLLSLSRTSREDRRWGIKGLGSGDAQLGLGLPVIALVAVKVLRAWWDCRDLRSLNGAGPMRKRLAGRVVEAFFSGGCAVACCRSCLRMVVKRV